ncbi:MAG: phosphoribosylformylglycinamidine synthase subunit PurL [Gemmatimonadetes bacterium]|nr:MAG: phosphoribosylformylglycinamidine synthase subunit PurL [Gemmatimonadota bacterium]
MEKRWHQVGLSDDEYQHIIADMGREPNDVELALYGVMWSEHCGYKNTRPLFKILPTTGTRVLQGPGENAGIVDIGDDEVITFKVESHNHPSAVAPYQGAATGVGGIIRDILAMGAFPIACLNSLCFGRLEESAHTRYLMAEVVRGIGDYGNCVGIPTVGGEVHFSEAYAGNPLVNAMCVGLMKKSEIKSATAAGVGNSVMIVGNWTGRDGVGGASFASKELDTEDDERGAIQVGDPFMEKLLIDACLEAFQQDFVIGVQDMGAAGIISSTSETAAKAGTGIEIDIDKVPQRESGMTPAEVMISESQERMLLIVEKGKEDQVNEIFHKWDLHAVTFGRVTGDGMIRVISGGEVVGEVPAKSLSEAPTYTRQSIEPAYLRETRSFKMEDVGIPDDLDAVLLQLLASPNICSKEWVYRQYDHMVQTNTVVKPGADAAVVRLKGKNKAIAITLDSNGRYVYLNPERGTEIVVAEAARNLVACGAEPIAVTDGLNFGNPEKPDIYYQLQHALQGMANACRALNTPIISGNASLYNETPHGAIYPTPMIGMVGLIPDLTHVMTPAFKNQGDRILLVGETKAELGASEYLEQIHGMVRGDVPQLDLALEQRTQQAVLAMIRSGWVQSVHDVGDGGFAVALAECAIHGGVGADIQFATGIRVDAMLFGESQSRFLVTCTAANQPNVRDLAGQYGVPLQEIGVVGGDSLVIRLNEETRIHLFVEGLIETYRHSLGDFF